MGAALTAVAANVRNSARREKLVVVIGKIAPSHAPNFSRWSVVSEPSTRVPSPQAMWEK
jgi:hypothetical protein